MIYRLSSALGVGILSLTLMAATLSEATAQDDSNTRATTQQNRDPIPLSHDNDDGFDLGWLGLAGLVGLMGLMKRDRTHLDRGAAHTTTAHRT